MDFLWVRWLARDGFYHSGWKACRLPQLSLIQPEDELPMYGFIDPELVVCRVHLIPAFAYGRSDYTRAPLAPGPSNTGHPEDEDNRDWNRYYINM